MLDVKLSSPTTVSFSLGRGERLGIIGESGSGKSMTALAMMGLVPAAGSVNINGEEIVGKPDRQIRHLRGRTVAMVFQEPMTALDPLMRVGKQIAEAGGDPETLLAEVGLEGRAQAYPHELSGGQRQRVLIAMAIAGNPDVLICDEPTTALDVTVQARILDVIDRIVTERSMGLIFISHDLAVVRRMSQRVIVMKNMAAVDEGTLDELSHPYSRQLIAASTPGPSAPRREHGEPIIELIDVSGTHALQGINLTVRRGERLGIVGESGSGKTTLLRLICGLEQAAEGQVRVDGRVQLVFQDPASSLNPRLRVGRSIREAGPQVAEALKSVGLPGVEERFPQQFSGGQRQRISIARALAADPDIVLADEPVSALDVSVRTQVMDALRVATEDATLVFVSHDLSVVRELCDTVVVLHEGRIVESGWITEVWDNPQDEYTTTLLAATPAL